MEKYANLKQGAGSIYLYACVTYTQIKTYIVKTPKSSLCPFPVMLLTLVPCPPRITVLSQ